MKALRVTTRHGTTTIALEHPGVLTAIVNCVDVPHEETEDIYLSLGGLDVHSNQHVRWPRSELEVGDVVSIEVINNCRGDEPEEVLAHDEEKERRAIENNVRRGADKLGWRIEEAKLNKSCEATGDDVTS